jgi:hypothetical protein
MSTIVSIHEAKTHRSRLLTDDAIQDGYGEIVTVV